MCILFFEGLVHVGNVRGAAAVLSENAKKLNGGNLPTNVNDWYAAVSQYSGAVDAQSAQSFADSVYESLQSGVSRTTDDGQKLQLNSLKGIVPNKQSLNTLAAPLAQSLNKQQHNAIQPECPSGLDCRFVPAYYGQNNPSDPADFGNYDPANRPQDMKIKVHCHPRHRGFVRQCYLMVSESSILRKL